MWQPFSIKKDLSPLLKLAIPLAFTGIVQSLTFFMETVFLARLSGEILAAGALVGWLFGTFAVILFGTLNAINILIAHKYGANDHHGISLVLRDGLLLAILLAIPAIILFWNIAPIFLLFGQNQSVVALATLYIHALVWGILPNFIIIVFLEFLMGLGHARVIMIFTCLSTSFIVFFSYIFIFGKLGLPAFGIAGAGWGATTSYWFEAVGLITYILLNKNYRQYLQSIFFFKTPTFLFELLQIGVPMGVMYSFEVAFFFALTLFMGYLDSKLLAANQVTMQYLGAWMSVIFSIAQAVTVRISHLFGARNIADIEATNNAGLFISGIFMSVIALGYWFIPKILIAIDFDLHDPSNAQIIHYAKEFLAIAALFQIAEALRITLFGSLRGLKDTNFTLVISLISFWGISLPLGYLFCFYFKLGGAGFWWGMVIGAIVSATLLYQRFKIKMRYYKKITVLTA